MSARNRHGRELFKRPVGGVGAGGQSRRLGEVGGRDWEKGLSACRLEMICRRDFWWSAARAEPPAPAAAKVQATGVGLRTAPDGATLDEEGDNSTEAMFQTGRQSCPRSSYACFRDGQIWR